MSLHQCRVTAHARERAIERLRADPRRAGSRVAELWACSVKLPPRYAFRFMRRERYVRRKDGVSYRLAGSVLLVCRGARVITLWCITDDQLVDVLLWSAGFPWPRA
jgi:hypothetical protein